jgi:hypothetical protein
MWLARGAGPWERQAYQVESDFLNKVGVSGTIDQVKKLIPGRNYEDGLFITYQAGAFEKCSVNNPAIRSR